jgi:hypothetical protein
MVPGVIMMMLALIPAMMTAVGVVREKEMGSITNLYATPVSGLEFLLGKQLPYVLIAFASYLSLLLLALLLFQVPVKGGLIALTGGAALYVMATTGFGVLVSSFVKTQIAALVRYGRADHAAGDPVLRAVHTGVVTFGGARIMGLAFPSTYFQRISIGTFTKGLELRRSRGPASALAMHRPRLPSAQPAAAEDAGGLNMRGHLENIYRLGLKELISLRYDVVLVALIVYFFTYAVYAPAKGTQMDLINASVAVVDEDGSPLSRRRAGRVAATLLPAARRDQRRSRSTRRWTSGPTPS